jgi:hypothetical protein
MNVPVVASACTGLPTSILRRGDLAIERSEHAEIVLRLLQHLDLRLLCHDVGLRDAHSRLLRGELAEQVVV